MTRYLLAIDQGTTSSRAIIFDLDGTLVHSVPDMHNAIMKTLTKYNLKMF